MGDVAFIIEPVVLSDFDELLNHPCQDDLVNVPFVPLCWPATTDEEARSRRRYYFTRMRHRFQIDPSLCLMKCVDTISGQIVSLANWHFYPNGYDTANEYWKNLDILAPPGVVGRRPAGLNWDLYEYITETIKLRDEWVPKDKPVWLLQGMVTRPSSRGRGAAGMLIDWGIKQSQHDMCFIGLEASTQGMPVYARYGFQQLGDIVECDCKPFGIDDVMEMAIMSIPAP